MSISTLHLAQLDLPLVGRAARVVKLAHDGKPWAPVELEVAIVELERAPIALESAEMQEFAIDSNRRSRETNRQM